MVIIGPNGRDYANNLKKISEKLCSSQTVIKWWSVIEEGYEVPSNFNNLGIIKKNPADPESRHSKHFSWIHGSGITLGIKELRKRVGPNEYIVISDADIIVLQQNWDIIFITKLKSVSLLGLPYDFGGKHKMGKCYYQNYPCATFMMFSSMLFKNAQVNFNFCPKLNSFGTLARMKLNKHLKKIMGKDHFALRPLKLDVGWRFILSLKKMNHQAIIFSVRKGENYLHPKSRTGMIEYELDAKLSIVHYVGSAYRPFKLSKIVEFNNNIREYIKKEFGLVI